MARPQRHRLLHGYPMAPLLRPTPVSSPAPWRAFDLDPSRPLLVGVLPHTFCNPSVRGCGFCTFPHEKHSNAATRDVVAKVVREVRALPEVFPEVMRRRVPALYFGGGTANLTPPDSFAELARALAETFDLRDAEISLEGVATYFLTRDQALLDVLERMPARHRRLSVGIQSFAPEWLARMGRTAFGTVETFASVVRTAHERNMTTSCDLLYNLPGQTLDASIDDITRASDLGFDQICIYNLVLDASIDSEWAHSQSLLARVAKPELGCERWLALREHLFALGFIQTTLTNFERACASPRFIYERESFDAATNDGLGFGPGAISTFTTRGGGRGERDAAIKWMNAATSREYSVAIERGGGARARNFTYTPLDLRLLHITRALSALRIDRDRYESFFGTDVLADFADVTAALVAAGLLVIEPKSGKSDKSESEDIGDSKSIMNGRAVSLTPRGMFYADAVAGLFAAARAAELREENDALAYAMG